MPSRTDHDDLLASSRLAVLATIKASGLPQLSPVSQFYDRDAGTLQVSMTEGRAKTANLRRDPRAAVEVTSSDGRAWATAEGPVTLTGPGTDPHGPEVGRSSTTTARPRASTRTGTSTGPRWSPTGGSS
jgi:PPOX class probable F420-dependent enzyme